MKIRSSLFLISVTLLFLSEKLGEEPFIISFVLVGLAGLYLLFGQVVYKSSPRLACFTAAFLRSKQPWLVVLALVLLFFSFTYTPLYFSDDAWRHIHDGFYLLAGVDVYSVPPLQLSPVVDGKLPNHPHLPTIYFPFTQAQAILAAALPIEPAYAFRFVYIAICVGLICGIWQLSSSNKRRSFYLHIFLTPWFCFFLACHHADLQGFLIVLFLGLAYKAMLLSLRQGNKKRAYILVFSNAFLTSLLSGLKPEGMWLTFSLHIFVMYQLLRIAKNKTGNYQLANKMIVLWLSSGLFCLAIQFAFLYFYLLSSAQSWASFAQTTRIFADWFLAYNPILEIYTYLYEKDLFRPQIFSLYRKQVLSLGILAFFMNLGWHLLLQKNSKRPVSKFSSLLGIQGRAAIYIGLTVIILAKGAWHPWYFLWVIGAFYAFGKPRAKSASALSGQIVHFLCSSLLLFYLPVVQLRSMGIWHMSSFYFVFAIFFLLWLFLACHFKSGRRPQSNALSYLTRPT